MPLGRSGMAPDSSLCPTGLPRMLKILFPALPRPAFSMFVTTMRAVLLELACSVELLVGTFAELALDSGVTPEEDLGVTVEDDCGVALEDSGSAGQFPPMQNASVSPGVPMSVILSPVLEPLYQRMAG